MFTQSDIARQIIFMHPTEGAQKIACSCPHSLGGINVHLSDTIAIIIPCPFVLTMVDGDTLALNRVVTFPFIRIRNRLGVGEACHVPLQGFAIGVLDDAQAHLSTLAPHRADNGGTIIVIGAVPFLFVRAATRRIRGIPVFSETVASLPGPMC